MRLLLTRPIPESERTASALRARGHDVLIAPMLRIENLPDADFGEGPWSALLMTSGNAARALSAHPKREAILGLHCFAVGHQTAEAARLVGFRQAISADGDAGDLVQLVAREVFDKSLPLLYLAGDDRARDMAAELSPAGLRTQTVVVYRAVAADRLEAEIVAALRAGAIDGVLHYSRRSSATLVACAQKAGMTQAIATLQHFCLSARASEPLAEIGASRIFVAERRDEQALLDLID